MTSSTAKKKAEELTSGYGLPDDALVLLREEVAWALDIAEARGRAAERGAVVAWLRREVDDDDHSEGPLACILAYAADSIERGEHRREGE